MDILQGIFCLGLCAALYISILLQTWILGTLQHRWGTGLQRLHDNLCTDLRRVSRRRVALPAGWVGHQRQSSPCIRRRAHCEAREDATGFPMQRTPSCRYRVIVEQKMGAGRGASPEPSIRTIEGRFARGRIWQVKAYPGDTWEVFHAAAARQMQRPQESFEVIAHGAVVRPEDLIPHAVQWVDYAWKRKSEDRSRTRPPARTRPGPEEEDAIYFYFEIGNGVWRLPVTLDEFPGGLPECTASQVAGTIKELYPHIFQKHRRLIIAADRDILRPAELMRRHWQQWREFSVATTVDFEQEHEMHSMPAGPQGRGLLLPAARLH